jgi:chemotaxis protein CheX
MAVTFQPALYEVPVTRIAEEVFRTMLGIQVVARPGSLAPATDFITAAIQFVGEGKGALLLQCGLGTALHLTHRLMPGMNPAAFDADVRDSLGELTNMMGGNLKSALRPGVMLGIPTAVEGTDFAMHICGGNESASFTFAGEGGDFAITLVHASESGAEPPAGQLA